MIKDDAFSTAAKLKNALSQFAEFEEGYKIGSSQIALCLKVLGLILSDLNSHLYWVEQIQNLRKFEPFGYENMVLIHGCVPEKKYFSIDGISRPSVKVCWPIMINTGIQSAHVNPDALGIPGARFNGDLDVYVQTHALRRLSERLDCIDPGVLQTHLFDSVDEPHACQQANGSFLIEYRLHGIKAGYLVADIVDAALVIRTFLFITNSGTPEGKKL